MFRRSWPVRVAGLAAFLSLLLFAVCGITAGYLYWQLHTTGQSLSEDVGSRKAAHELETTLKNLADLLAHGSDQVDALEERVHDLLEKVNRLADKEEETRLVGQLRQGYQTYRQLKRQVQAGQLSAAAGSQAALGVILQDLLPACRQLRDFNAEQIEKSEAEHRQSIRHMVWGLIALGTLGALTGLILGYVLARGLRHSLCQMSVCLRDAAGKLGAELPAVQLNAAGDLHGLRTQLQEVVREIEQVVRRLQEREREVLRAEQLRAVGQLAAGAAHELRNPLTAIKLLIQASRERTDRGGLADSHLALIEREIRRMERCLQAFLDFARPPRLVCRPVELAALIEGCFALLQGRAAQQGVELRFQPPSEPVYVHADPGQLQQVLINLALNALDAMPQGGVLEMRLGRTPAGQVELQVLDTGPGLSAELLPRMFEPFVSTKETGLGLGLVVSRRIVESHQGTLQAGNRPEGGACFTVCLPELSAAVASA
jgi:two-component system sensor histidine kinase HydH